LLFVDDTNNRSCNHYFTRHLSLWWPLVSRIQKAGSDAQIWHDIFESISKQEAMDTNDQVEIPPFEIQ